ncbi:117R [Cherax quadricarinatus iridovirus]|nr:117R [Cherax quadricarinatus iridovirus]UPA43427.1 117R [Iridovirus CN01]ASZ85097.1 117R [Cherax quadricarinatus iridovirus]UPA43503.1 117R [Iridovirus CN01]UPA43699.1 117R [Iridovirus CN01]UPA43861.1 117R [Iridovirus CN01]
MRVNENICQEFSNRPSVNPLTNRKIQKGKGVYNELKKKCDSLGCRVQSRSRSRSRSRRSSRRRSSRRRTSPCRPCPRRSRSRSRSRRKPARKTPPRTCPGACPRPMSPRRGASPRRRKPMGPFLPTNEIIPGMSPSRVRRIQQKYTTPKRPSTYYDARSRPFKPANDIIPGMSAAEVRRIKKKYAQPAEESVYFDALDLD